MTTKIEPTVPSDFTEQPTPDQVVLGTARLDRHFRKWLIEQLTAMGDGQLEWEQPPTYFTEQAREIATEIVRMYLPEDDVARKPLIESFTAALTSAHTTGVKEAVAKIKERRDYFASKDLHNGWSGRESGPCCEACAMRAEHFNGRADALKAIVGCRNPFQFPEVCQCHISVREAVKAGIVESHNQLLTALAPAAAIGEVGEGGRS